MNKQPTPRECMHCDFASGYRGMDRCTKCDGTGSVFRIAIPKDPNNGWKTFPNTIQGFVKAKAYLNENYP